MSISINFLDVYGGRVGLYVAFNESVERMFGTIEDFLKIVGDQVTDDSAFIAIDKFATFLSRMGYPVERASTKRGMTHFEVNLVSGEILPSKEMGEMLRAPTKVDRFEELSSLSESVSGEQLSEGMDAETVPIVERSSNGNSLEAIGETLRRYNGTFDFSEDGKNGVDSGSIRKEIPVG